MILIVALSGTAALLMTANRAQVSSDLRNRREALIDADVATIKDLSERYTCCPGSCTVNIATINASSSCAVDYPPADIDREDYYFPVGDQTAIDAFSKTNYDPATGNISSETGFCKDGTLVNNLVTAVQAIGPIDGVSRTVNVDDASVHRIRVTYSSTNPTIGRVVKIIPTVAAWCP
ncbi:hypothetical protein [Vulcanococcus limneticus]|uniref:hypothetical protein n=1 Tax=Vulcanococcus limneticus TaxID=2170428 RepID=UPI00398C016F